MSARMAQAPAHKVASFVLPQGPSQPPGNADAAYNVVGTWLVNYDVNGTTITQALVQWHADGTEWQSANQPVTNGNICVGSWKVVDTKHVSRYHMGWTYADGTLSGYLIETETNKVTGRGTYSGEFDTKVYDLDGNLLKEVIGTTSGVKLVP